MFSAYKRVFILKNKILINVCVLCRIVSKLRE